jgi:hypothetical protein
VVDAVGVVVAPFAAEGGGEDHGAGALDLPEGFAGGFFTLLGVNFFDRPEAFGFPGRVLAGQREQGVIAIKK